jgi:diguanylate cyclase (GGDEF)-like protein
MFVVAAGHQVNVTECLEVFERRLADSWIVRGSIAGLLAVLCFLTGFSVLTQRRVAGLSQRADRAARLSAAYQDARFWVGQEESLERKYRLEPGPDVRALHAASERALDGDLRLMVTIDPSPGTRAVAIHLQSLNVRYIQASTGMLRAVDEHNTPLVIHFDHGIVDPIFGTMQDIVYAQARGASHDALTESAKLRQDEGDATRALSVAFAVGLLLLGVFGTVIVRFRRRLDAARLAEVKRLAEIAITDALTGLRNHRAFHEDLARSVHRVGRTGIPISLVLLDLDGLKQINDTLGHQIGDERIRALADAIRASGRGADSAYRIGGDEFAIILDDVRAWTALEYAQRLRAALEAQTAPTIVTASAGIHEATTFVSKDELFRKAELALLASQRSLQHVSLYTPEMDPETSSYDADEDQHNRTLASALARAVDAKDSYTRSHCQTVSQLCALIAAELGFDDTRLARVRLAGLLHDVGKIGIPDAILNKPAKLTDAEYEQMQTHSLLGHDIVAAADLPTEAIWVRHHHERYDGRGYPDRLAATDIPLESRIILVADAFEAMTSDRPYRKAPGRDFAIAELRRHARTQFDPEIVDALCRALDQRASVSGAPTVEAAAETPSVVLFSTEDLESLEESLAVISERSIAAQLRESQQSIAAGENGVELAGAAPTESTTSLMTGSVSSGFSR